MTFTSFLTELPKCEHHVHLEGTLEPELLFKLAARNNIKLPSTFPESVEQCDARYKAFSDLQDFLDHYYIGMSVLIHEQDFYDLAIEYFRKAHGDNCLHSEVFFDPQGHIERGVSMETVVAGFNRACADAKDQFGTTNKLIMCLLRHLPPLDGLNVIEQAKPFYSSNIIHGLGLDSSEKPFPPHLFAECYESLKKNHPEANLTAHAGEEGDHTFVTNSIDLLNVTRIDHGINSQYDPDLLKRLASEKILLSVCPFSNVKLNVVQDVGELPIKLFLDNNVPFSINSDDPAYFGGYILDNYLEVHSKFNFTAKQWVKIAENSIHGSWCDDARKAQLLEHVNQVYIKYQHLDNE
jgi:adenosine deaminase